MTYLSANPEQDQDYEPHCQNAKVRSTGDNWVMLSDLSLRGEG